MSSLRHGQSKFLIPITLGPCTVSIRDTAHILLCTADIWDTVHMLLCTASIRDAINVLFINVSIMDMINILLCAASICSNLPQSTYEHNIERGHGC